MTDLEETIHERDMQLEERENAGEDIRGDPYSYLSDDDDFLEPKIAENRQLALWHLVNRLVQEII